METVPTDVSRETRERLETLLALVGKWTRRINLVAPSTVEDAWRRHILDSIQVHQAAPAAQHWADLGTGGGFPGLVVAVLETERTTPAKVTLVESDRRKCTFLRTALRETGAQARVIDARIEHVPPLGADVLSARALAPLGTLLGFAHRHLAPGGTALFPKGARWREEIAAAERDWTFSAEPIPSITDPDAVLLRIGGIAPHAG
ncbi:16S rRNA (guanine(527)-N(7))-methyltransferase RsmG [Rhodosalinus sediminis]|uniref:16S rRNA (guanine(527)-N(7))-methyltransferase RsmG n=1 Tax=Rhodosalinus sediminis TaxID=1940533 RepID=UPI001EFCA487|nr:16S rRNA (guanine(527)-N(7))-methyltransferase RsmG [Rhodosalinus sediminis]